MIKSNNIHYIIEICHGTIDLSISMYFKSLGKTIPLLADKIIRDEKADCVKQLTTHLINNTDVGQLIKEVEQQVNDQLQLLVNIPVPKVKFNNINVDLAYQSLVELVGEEKCTLKLIKCADQTANKISAKMISNIVPQMMVKSLTACCAKTISKGMGIDKSEYHNAAQNLVERHLTQVLATAESQIKSHLKYQLAEQLYSWDDQNKVDTVSLPSINNYA